MPLQTCAVGLLHVLLGLLVSQVRHEVAHVTHRWHASKAGGLRQQPQVSKAPLLNTQQHHQEKAASHCMWLNTCHRWAQTSQLVPLPVAPQSQLWVSHMVQMLCTQLRLLLRGRVRLLRQQ